MPENTFLLGRLWKSEFPAWRFDFNSCWRSICLLRDIRCELPNLRICSQIKSSFFWSFFLYTSRQQVVLEPEKVSSMHIFHTLFLDLPHISSFLIVTVTVSYNQYISLESKKLSPLWPIRTPQSAHTFARPSCTLYSLEYSDSQKRFHFCYINQRQNGVTAWRNNFQNFRNSGRK